MKSIFPTLPLLVVVFALTATARAQSTLNVGSTYDIVRNVELRSGPGENYSKKINQKASDALRRVDYLNVDRSCTIKLLDVKGDWAEIQVVYPAFLADTHRGWIPASAIKPGKATNKREGSVEHTCLVYPKKDANSKPIGYLPQRAAVSVVDDGPEWLEISMTGLAPAKDTVMDIKTNTLLGQRVKPPMFIEAKNFIELPP